MPMQLVCVCPEGFEPDQATLTQAQLAGVSEISVTHDMDAALGSGGDVDYIYTDVWASMGQKEETATREAIFAPYQVNRALMERAGSQCRFLHCFPAERGREVTDSTKARLQEQERQ